MWEEPMNRLRPCLCPYQGSLYQEGLLSGELQKKIHPVIDGSRRVWKTWPMQPWSHRRKRRKGDTLLYTGTGMAIQWLIESSLDSSRNTISMWSEADRMWIRNEVERSWTSLKTQTDGIHPFLNLQQIPAVASFLQLFHNFSFLRSVEHQEGILFASQLNIYYMKGFSNPSWQIGKWIAD